MEEKGKGAINIVGSVNTGKREGGRKKKCVGLRLEGLRGQIPDNEIGRRPEMQQGM